MIPELHVALFEAMQRGDLATARAVNDRIHPLANAVYGEPFLDMHNRMEEALVPVRRWLTVLRGLGEDDLRDLIDQPTGGDRLGSRRE